MKKWTTVLPVLLSLLAQAQQYYLLSGTYTSGKSEGIYAYKFNSATGDAVPVSTAKTTNPSFLSIAPGGKTVYAVNENKPGTITAFSFNKTMGTLQELNQQSSSGDHPCYINTHQSGKWVVAGNYSTGNLSVFPVNRDGSLGSTAQMIQHKGSGPVAARQKGPHVHATEFSPDGNYLFVPDLGNDKIMIYRFNQQTGKLTTHNQPFEKSKGGSGPRHLAFHPNGRFAYLMQELSGDIKVMQYDGQGHLVELQGINAYTSNYQGAFGSADIHVSPDGNFVYCSNRAGSNTIAIFKVHPEKGVLTLAGHQSTLGNTPRNFNFDPSGNYLLVANQDSDAIVIFKINKATGLLTDTGKRIAIPNPVCIKWIPME